MSKTEQMASPLGQGHPTLEMPSPVPPQGRKKWKRAVACAALALALIVAVLLPFVLRAAFPASAIYAAVARTLRDIQAEHLSTRKALGAEQALQLLRAGPAQQEGYIQAAQGAASSGQFGLRVRLDSDLPQEQISAEIDFESGGLPVARAGFAAQGGLLSFSLPALFGGSYGLNTETLGYDLSQSPLGELLGFEVPTELSFNLFDLLNPLESGALLSYAAQSRISSALSEAAKSLVVQPAGRQATEVNGQTQNCTLYRITLPAAVARETILQIGSALADDHRARTGLAWPVSGDADIGRAAQQIADALESDLSLSLYVRGGRVRLAVAGWETRPQGEGQSVPASVSLEIGTPKQLGAAFTITVTTEGKTARLNHQGTILSKAAPYASQTEVSVSPGSGEPALRIFYCEVQYDPLKTQNNFTAECLLHTTFEITVNVNGNVVSQPSEGRVSAEFDTLHLTFGGEEAHLFGGYSVSPLDKMPTMPQPTLLTGMNREQLDSLASEIQKSLLGMIFA